jgi:hypothetical protein
VINNLKPLVLAAAFITIFAPPGSIANAQEPRSDLGSAVDVNAAQDALQLNYRTAAALNQIKSDLDYGLLISDNRDIVGSADWMFHTTLTLVPRLSFSIGPKLYLAKLNIQNSGAFAAAVNGDIRYDLIRRYGIAVFGSAAYAPHVLMFGSADNVTDFSAGIQIRFARRLYALGGYRWFNFKFPSGIPDDRIENSVFAGLRYDLTPGLE